MKKLERNLEDGAVGILKKNYGGREFKEGNEVTA
jgi:hypothetical protein